MPKKGYFSNYCGLGGEGSTQHATDEACKEHDEMFSAIQSIGGEPYLHYVQADTDLFNRLWNTKTQSTSEEFVRQATMAYAALKHLLPRSNIDMPRREEEDKLLEVLLEPDAQHEQILTRAALRQKQEQRRQQLVEQHRKQLMDTAYPKTKRPTQMTVNKSPAGIEHQPRTVQRDLSVQFEYAADPESRFNWNALSNMQQGDQDVEMQVSSRSAPSTSNSNRNIASQETPIIYAQPTYRLPETHTTILTTTFFGSGVIRGYDALDMVLRLNDYKEPLTTKLSAKPNNVNSNTIGANFTAGLYNSKIPQWNFLSPNGSTPNATTSVNPANSYPSYNGPNAQRWPANALAFASTLDPNSHPIPKMAEYFEQFFLYYTTLGCEYEIIINNTQQGHQPGNGDLMCCTVIDTYIDNANKNNNQTLTQQKLGNVIYWPEVKKHFIPCAHQSHPESEFYTIKGTHKPGDGRRMVENDGDQQRWTRTNSSLSADAKMFEELHLMFFQHPFNTVHNRTISGISDTATSAESLAKNSFNFQINLKYIVQFKDLRKDLREPRHNDTPSPAFGIAYTDVANAINQTIT
jgi:hypothetical protein